MNGNDNTNEGQGFGDFGRTPTEAREEEGDNGDDVNFDPLDDNDTLEEVEDELDANDGRHRGWEWVSYSTYWNKECHNYHGDKESSHYDYDLYRYRHVDRHVCKSKCNNLVWLRVLS